jgi:hypothetical protein
MLNRARYSPVLDRFAGSGLGRLALVLGAAWGLSCAMPAPARAMDTGWRQGCAYKSEPATGNSEMWRRYYCDREAECQRMANAAGHMITANGCFFVSPEPTQQQAGKSRLRR